MLPSTRPKTSRRLEQYDTREETAIPLYFFNVHDGQGPLAQDPPDADGSLFAHPEAARSAVVVLAGELLKDLDGKFWSGSDWTLAVTDQEGATVCVLRFSGALAEA
jgi:hypothetical protein